MLNFSGNEFGHPEWVDFPRQGNDHSYQYARRQWSLAADHNLRYQDLLRWNEAVLTVEQHHRYLQQGREHTLLIDDTLHVVASERPKGKLLWIWNFHPSISHTDIKLTPTVTGEWEVVLSSDEARFGGHARVQLHHRYSGPTFQIYVPTRSLILLQRK